MYATPDESLDVRQRNTVKRLKERHEREKNDVRVTAEGAIFAENGRVFSTKDGFSKRSAAGSTCHDD